MATTYLNRTPSSEGNRKTWTFSTWFKISNITDGAIFTAGASGQDEMTIRLEESSGNFNIDWQLYKVSNSTTIGRLITNRQFRDPSAWYHLVCRYDSTNSTAGDRMRIYINGVEETSFSTDTNPTLNYDAMVNNTVIHNIGRQSWNNSGYFDGYLSQTILADGQSYAPTVFGSTNANGVWIPNTSPSVTYGTNGFKIDYAGTGTSADSSGFGADSSGQTNHYASNNLGTNPNTKDTPHNLFCTLNIVDSESVDLSKGGCDFDSAGGSADGVRATMGVLAGKWYYECKITGSAGLSAGNIGYSQSTMKLNANPRGGQCMVINGSSAVNFYNFSSNAVVLDANSGIGQNDIVGVALNLTDNQITFYKNGAQIGSTQSIASGLLQGDFFIPCVFDDGGVNDVVGSFNFGNPTFSLSNTPESDANGYGSFEYAVPSGYYALCTKNLAQYG